MTGRSSILFVDDDPNVLSGIKRMLFGKRDQWVLFFANGGREALELCRQSEVDVLVTDLRMPDVNGAALLSAVQEEMPRTVRIALSGHSDTDMILGVVRSAHQFLAKPCESSEIIRKVEYVLALRDLITNPRLQQVVSQLTCLPPCQASLDRLIRAIEDENAMQEDVAQIVREDASLTVKLLQLVNSAYFGLASEVTDVEYAVSLLGTDVLRSLVVSIKVFEAVENLFPPSFPEALYWRHTAVASERAKRIARGLGCSPEKVKIATSVALVHDIGHLLCATSFPDIFTRSCEASVSGKQSFVDVEQELLGTSHAQIGAYLLGLWGLPSSMVELVANHHAQPEGDPTQNDPITRVLYLVEHMPLGVNRIEDQFDESTTEPEILEQLAVTLEDHSSWFGKENHC